MIMRWTNEHGRNKKLMLRAFLFLCCLRKQGNHVSRCRPPSFVTSWKLASIIPNNVRFNHNWMCCWEGWCQKVDVRIEGWCQDRKVDVRIGEIRLLRGKIRRDSIVTWHNIARFDCYGAKYGENRLLRGNIGTVILHSDCFCSSRTSEYLTLLHQLVEVLPIGRDVT